MTAYPPPPIDPWVRRMSAWGHEDAFPRPRLSARCRFSQGTFAGTWGNGRDAPTAVIGRSTGHRPPSTLLGHSASHSERLFLCRVSDTGPLMIYPPLLMAGVRKPSGKEPAGGGVGGLLSMGICRGSVLGRGCTGRRNGGRTANRVRGLFVVPAVGRA